MRDEAEIRGHRRTYIGAMPGKIINAMISAKSSNPLMLLDEIDKLAGDFRGDPAAALLEALDPKQNSTFNDHFIDMSFDLSHVLFITTANDLSAIPGPLRDRMDVIELPSYTRVEKYNIARKHLVPKQLKACGLSGKVTFCPECAVRHHRRLCARSRRPQLGAYHHQRAAQVCPQDRFRRGGKLRRHRFQSGRAAGPQDDQARLPQPHQCHRHRQRSGMDQRGGETLPIEVQVMDNGSGKITVTGSLGDVMKESAQLAVTYVRVHADEYGIDPERLKNVRPAHPRPRKAQCRRTAPPPASP